MMGHCNLSPTAFHTRHVCMFVSMEELPSRISIQDLLLVAEGTLVTSGENLTNLNECFHLKMKADCFWNFVSA
jgi:hypothetical protein